MKKQFLLAFVIMLASLLLGLVVSLAAPNVAGAQAGCDNNRTYLHVACATASAHGFWNDNPGYWWHYRRSYIRHNANRVDILGQGWRHGVYGCRWIIVRGSDYGRYSYWHPSYGFGCSGH